MGSLNKVQLIGRLTRDPEVKTTANGNVVAQFSLATNRYSRGDDGDRQEAADFHDCVAWNSGTRTLAETCATYLAKGRLVYVEGRLQTRSWETDDGTKRYRTEVVVNDVQFLESARETAAVGADDEYALD